MNIKRKTEYQYIPELYFLTIYTFSKEALPYWKISNYCIRLKALKTKKLYRYTLGNRRHKVSIAPPKKKGEYFIPRTKNLPWKEIE
jgi:hypothetical protein